MDKNHEELIAQFMEVSGATEHVAKFYLASSNWSVEDGLANFLSSQQEEGEMEEMDEPVVNLPSSINMSDLQRTVQGFPPGGSSLSGDSFNIRGNRGGGSSSNRSGSTRFGASGSTTNKPKIATLKDMKQNEEMDEDEGQAFYAGGSDRSGQQVIGPPKRKDFRDQLTEIFRLAQRNTAIHDHSRSRQGGGPSGGGGGSESSSSSAANSWGQGMRLGMTDTDHTAVPSGTGKDRQRPVVILRLWSQGFTVDDEELRSYEDPENKEFLQTVMRGEIPQELLNVGYTVNVDVEDHRFEEYRKPKTMVKSFKGSGQALGSPVPQIVEDTPTTVVESKSNDSEGAAGAAASAASSNDQEEAAAATKNPLKVDTSAPTTNLQIRLSDGSRLAGQFNLTHTVADIYNYIQTARPQYASREFVLVSSFPTRELNDHSLTIEKADLKNAALMQRLK